MKFLPVSLTTRTILLIIAVVAVAEVTTFSLFSQYRKDMHASRMAHVIGGQIRLLQTILPHLDDNLRQRLIAADEGEQWLKLRPDDAFVPKRDATFGFARRLAATLKQILGEEVAVRLRHEGPDHYNGIWIGFAAGGENWWLLLRPPHFAPQGLPSELWLRLVAALTLLAIIAILFARGIVASLNRLGEAVAAVGGGQAREMMPEGPKEVQLLAERYNTMIRQLRLAESERREMLAGLTHDLRAPLARLRVRLALLDNEADRAGVSRDADDMEHIVNQCLSFLRSETMVSEPSGSLLPFADAVSNEIARRRETGREVLMRVADNAVLSQVAIAPGELQRLLDNLIDNAFQHGQPPVEIFLAAETGWVTLTVSDHGQGIAPDQRARAFEAFAQINPERATSGHCGLGLAIVRRIVAAAKGEITLDETPNGGLTVFIRLPTA